MLLEDSRMSLNSTVSTKIARPCSEVWNFITDFNKASLWIPSINRVEQPDEGELGRGSTLKFIINERVTVRRIRYWEPDKCLILTAFQKSGEIDTCYRLTPCAIGTKLEVEVSIGPSGFQLLATPFLIWMAKRDTRLQLVRVKQLLEQELSRSLQMPASN